MAINFPDSPNTNDTYTYGNRTWVYTGSGWKTASSNTSVLAISLGGTGASDSANARINLGLEIGADVQAYDAGLEVFGGLSKTDGNFIVGDGSTWVVESGSTARTSLGLGTISTQDSNDVTISGGEITGLTDLSSTLATITTASITTATITTANITSGRANTVVFATEYDNGNSGTSKTINFGNGQKQKITITGNCTFTFTAPPGPGNFLLKMVYGGSNYTGHTWPATVKWGGAASPSFTPTSGNTDIVTFYFDGTNYYGVASLDFV